MAISGVPLHIGAEGALHSAEDMRMMTYFMMRGQEGFLTATAGKARPLDIPGGGIILGQGPMVINSAFPGGTNQAYMTRIISDHQVDLEPNLTNSTVYDLVVCNIEDPEPSGGTIWPYPGIVGSDARKFGPYWRPRIIQNVPSNTVCLDDLPTNRAERNWSAIPSCLLTRTPQSNYITGTHIKPLNVVANPFNGLGIPPAVLTDIGTISGTVGGLLSGRIQVPGTFTKSTDCVGDLTVGVNSLPPGTSTFKRFPREAIWTPLVPSWATYCEAFVVATGLYQKATAANVDAHVFGVSKLKLGAFSESAYRIFDFDEVNSYDNRAPTSGDSTAYDTTKRPGNRVDIHTTDTFPIDSRDRNKKVNLELLMASSTDPRSKGKLVADNYSGLYVELRFKETP